MITSAAAALLAGIRAQLLKWDKEMRKAFPYAKNPAQDREQHNILCALRRESLVGDW